MNLRVVRKGLEKDGVVVGEWMCVHREEGYSSPGNEEKRIGVGSSDSLERKISLSTWHLQVSLTLPAHLLGSWLRRRTLGSRTLKEMEGECISKGK